MTTIRTVAAHEVVRHAYPRPITEADELGLAAGKAIDTSLAQYGYEHSLGRKPTATAMNRLAATALDDELSDAHVTLAEPDRSRVLSQIAEVLRVYRKSVLFGLSRPRSRLIVIHQQVGVYAQPDYWDRVGAIFEMKSYHAVPRPPDVQLQLELFQLAFPGFVEHLVSINRHSIPVELTDELISPLSPARTREVLELAYRTGLELGLEKVLEYVDNPKVHLEFAP